MVFHLVEKAWGIFVCLGLAGAAAYAVERPIQFQSHGYSTPSNAEWTRVYGRVSFERRSTIVPMSNGREAAFCESLSCPHSDIYWAVVISDGMNRYEVREAFSKGQKTAPAAVRLDGVVLRPGVEVEMEAAIQPVAPSYGVVTSVRSVSVVMDQIGENRRVSNFWWPESDGWTCQTEPNQGSETLAQVWYGRDTRGYSADDSYHLGVWERASAQPNVNPMVEMDNLAVRVAGNEVIFEGRAQGDAAQLVIEGYASRPANLPAMLTVSGWQPADIARRGAVNFSVSLICSRNRFVQY